jgi:SAM-dependent methyltransferase
MNKHTKERLENLLPYHIYQIGKFFFKIQKDLRKKLGEIRNHIVMQLYRSNIVSASRLYDDNYYTKRKKGKHRERAEKFSQSVDNIINPESVVDFGCGIGQHLEIFHSEGKKVRGFDIKPICKEKNLVPKEKIDIRDLTQEWATNEEYQLGICLEVLEHIPPEYEDQAVENISKLVQETLLISAAPPGQGGTHHVNERPNNYWEEKFRNKGFILDKNLTNQIKESLNFDGVRKHNLLVLKKES